MLYELSDNVGNVCTRLIILSCKEDVALYGKCDVVCSQVMLCAQVRLISFMQLVLMSTHWHTSGGLDFLVHLSVAWPVKKSVVWRHKDDGQLNVDIFDDMRYESNMKLV